MWGNLKQKVYVNNPHTIEELENEIRRVLSEITRIELQKVLQNLGTIQEDTVGFVTY
ncbi:hypothetical protein C0J52_04657 [Blattella germanica]|nr:hypothetical protein C0J52_04657 [Blattella germanica]